NCPAGSVEAKAGVGDICLRQLINGTAGANGVCNSATTSPAVPADAACAATNGAVVDALDPDFVAKAGANAGQYPVVGFFEGGPDPGQGGSGTCPAARPCTVTFKRFATTDCSGTVSNTQSVACISDGSGTGTCTATSSTFTTQVPPGYSYLATYNGDSNYPAV